MKKRTRYPMSAMGFRHNKLYNQGDFPATRNEFAINRMPDKVCPSETQRDTVIVAGIIALIIPDTEPDAQAGAYRGRGAVNSVFG